MATINYRNGRFQRRRGCQSTATSSVYLNLGKCRSEMSFSDSFGCNLLVVVSVCLLLLEQPRSCKFGPIISARCNPLPIELNINDTPDHVRRPATLVTLLPGDNSIQLQTSNETRSKIKESPGLKHILGTTSELANVETTSNVRLGHGANEVSDGLFRNDFRVPGDLSSSGSNNYYEHIQPINTFFRNNYDRQHAYVFHTHQAATPQASSSTPRPVQGSGLSTTAPNSQTNHVNPPSQPTREQIYPTDYRIMQQVAQPAAQSPQAPTRWRHFSSSLINLISYNGDISTANRFNTTPANLQSGPLRKALMGLQNPQLLGGDILLKTGDRRIQNGRLIKFERSALVSPVNLWPNGVIYYELDASVYHLIDLIWSVMQQFHSETCIKFIPRENNEPDYLRIEALKGCFSYIGRIGGEQTLSLGDGCEYRGTIAHELLHAVGFFHHQNRSDRDDFLEILWDNIAKGKENQFTKMAPQENILLNEFDYNSIMLYGPHTFGKTLDKVTMKPKREGVILLEVVDKQGLSTLDISSVNKLYKCETSSYK